MLSRDHRPPWNDDDNEPNTISESYIVSFDIGENLDIPTAVVAKQSTNGIHIINIISGDRAIILFEDLTGEEFEP